MNNKLVRIWRNWNPHALLGGKVKWYMQCLKNNLRVPVIVNIELPYNLVIPLLVYTQEN